MRSRRRVSANAAPAGASAIHPAPPDAAGAQSERLQLAIEATRDGLWDWNLESGIAFLNQRYYEMTGYGADEVVPDLAFFRRLAHPDDFSRVMAAVTAHLEGRSNECVVEYRMLTKAGDVRWVQARGSVVERDGRGRARRMVGMVKDITDRKVAEIELRQSEERLRVALMLTQLLVFHQDRQLRYTWIANPALGMTADEIVGRSDDEILGAAGAEVMRIKRRVLRTGCGERREVWVSREGRSGCFDLIVEPRRDPGGRIVGLACAAADITERKRAEQELAAARQSLQDLAGHLQDALEAERRALASDVHDHVGAMLTGLQLKLVALARDLPPGAQALRAGIREAGDLAARILDSTREICARLRPPALDDLGLAETCRWYLRDWAKATGHRAVGRFATLRPEPSPALAIDVFRILQELLTNVAKHAEARRVRVALSSGRRGLRLCVTDDGRGFVPGSTHRGFGLAGIRERAGRHAGTVDVDTGPAGTRVTVGIPERRS